MLSRSEVAALVDHTLLKPEATGTEVEELLAEAADLGTYAVCISPNQLPLRGSSSDQEQSLAIVCGFPSGAHMSEIKVAEAAKAVAHGAQEIDMVINLKLVKEGNFTGVRDDIAAVRQACPQAVLKVIIESAALNPAEIVACCEAAEDAGADFVKTSTGFHPAGGASVAAVKLMADTVGGRLGIKASGGIRDAETAQAMIEAGATRLGLSASREVLAGFPE